MILDASLAPTSEPAVANAGIAQLQRMLTNKKMKSKILKEAVEFAPERI